MVSIDEKVGVPTIVGRFSRGAVKTVISPFIDPIGTMKGTMEAIPDTLKGIINMPEKIADISVETYYLGHRDWYIDGEETGEILLPAIAYTGMVSWMAKKAYDATQVADVGELASTGYIAAGCYVAANALVSGFRWLDRRMSRPVPVTNYHREQKKSDE